MLAVALAAAVVALPACAAPGDDRGEPTEVVQRYLDAIAAGDATTARELDAAAVDDAPADPLTDTETLRTDAALDGAQRIDDVTVDTDTDTTGDDTERAVTVSYTLSGETYDEVLTVAWDEDAGEWVLQDTLAEALFIQAQVTRIEAAVIGFSVPGAAYPAPVDQESAPIQWLAYPGVYAVTADLDPALLVDPAAGVTRDAVVAASGEQPSLVFDVTALP